MSVPAIVGSLLVGALAGGLFGGKSKTPSFSAAPVSFSTPDIPEVPNPEPVDQAGEENATQKAMNEAAEKEKLEALKRQQGGQEIFTSALGAPGQASTYRKQLLGA